VRGGVSAPVAANSFAAARRVCVDVSSAAAVAFTATSYVSPCSWYAAMCRRARALVDGLLERPCLPMPAAFSWSRSPTSCSCVRPVIPAHTKNHHPQKTFLSLLHILIVLQGSGGGGRRGGRSSSRGEEGHSSRMRLIQLTLYSHPLACDALLLVWWSTSGLQG
jgi:hypothetical protein